MRVLQLRSQRAVQRLCFSADGGQLAAIPEESWRVAVIDTASNRRSFVSVVRSHPRCVAFSWDGNFFAVGGSDGTARPYRVGETDRPLAELRIGSGASRGHQPVAAVAFAPTADPVQQWLAACGHECWLWNPITQQYLVVPDREHFFGAAFDVTAESVFLMDGEGVSRWLLKPFRELWRATTEQLRIGFSWSRPNRVAAAPLGTVLAISADHLLVIADAGTGQSRVLLRFETWVRDLAFLPSSRLLAVADGSPTFRVYDTDTGTVAREYDWGIGNVHCVTFSHDGAMGAAGGDKGNVVVWDVE